VSWSDSEPDIPSPEQQLDIDELLLSNAKPKAPKAIENGPVNNSQANTNADLFDVYTRLYSQAKQMT